VQDVANFAMLHLNAGRFRGRPVLTPASVALMHRPQTSLYTVFDEGYGLTFRTERYKGIRLLRHDGVTMYYSSVFYLAPDHDLGVSIVFNSMAAPVGGDALAKSIFDELLELPAEQTRPQPARELQSTWAPSDRPRLTGDYLSLNAGLATIGVIDEHLILDFNGTIVPLEMYAPNIYFGYSPRSGALVSAGFVPATGEARYLLVNGSLFERYRRDPDYRPDIALLETYAGTYVGDTDTLVVECEEGALVARSPEQDGKMHFVALGPTSFVGPRGLIEFSVSEARQVTGLTQGRFYALHRAD
jgi:hypothetical protein